MKRLLQQIGLPMMAFAALSLLVAFSLSGSQERRLSSLQVRSEGQLEATLMPLLASNDPIVPDPYLITISARPDVPRQLRAGEGFPIRVTFDVSAQQSGETVRPDSFAMQSIRRELVRSLTASLNVAGLTVEPKGFTPVDGTLSSAWSVRSSDGGSYVGILAAVLKEPVTFGTTRSDLPGSLELSLQVTPPPRTPKDIAALSMAWVGGLSGVVGLILSVLSLIDRRRKQREERAEKDQRIYKPDGTPLGR